MFGRETVYASMVDLVSHSLQSAFIALNQDDKIVEYRLSNRKIISGHLKGKSFHAVISKLFCPNDVSVITEALLKCRKNHRLSQIRKLAVVNSFGEYEYFSWNFEPVSDTDCVVVFIQNITESVLIENEFNVLCEQQDSMNRELCIAMSKLDFQYMDLEQAHKKLAALYRITSVVQRTIALPEIFSEIIAGLTDQLGYVNAAIFLLDQASQTLIIKAHKGYMDDITIPVGQGVTGYAVASRELVYVPDVGADERYIPGTNNGTAEIAIPLIVDDIVIGVLDVETPADRIIKDYDLDLLRSLGSQIALTTAHAQYVDNVQTQAITDSLTGLFNFRYFRTASEQEFKRAVRYERPLSMLMIDIDNYKHYNDINGHRMGDEVLRLVASLLKQSVRDVDIVFRYGGEEFVILCPETFLDEAEIIAERVRKSIEQYLFPNREKQPRGILSVSIGISEYPRDAASIEQLIDHADIALYTAKRCNKNCVRIYRLSE